jgi:hypothetical protein
MAHLSNKCTEDLSQAAFPFTLFRRSLLVLFRLLAAFWEFHSNSPRVTGGTAREMVCQVQVGSQDPQGPPRGGGYLIATLQTTTPFCGLTFQFHALTG